MLEPDSRAEGERADFNFVLKIYGGRKDLLKTRGTDRFRCGGAKTAESAGGVENLLVRAARAVVVEAQSNGEVMGYRAGVEAEVGLVLPAVGFVLAEGIAGENVTDAGALEDGERGAVEQGFGDVGAACAAEAVKFIPISLEGIEVNGGFDTERIRWFRDPFEIRAEMLGGVVVELGGGVAAVRIVAQVGYGDAAVGFVRVEIGVAELELEALLEVGVRFEK